MDKMIYSYLLMCLIYGTTFYAIKAGIDAGFSPFLFAATRFGTAGVLIIAFLYLKKSSLRLTRRNMLDLIYLGVCMTLIPCAALYWAEQYISSGLAALLSASGPIIVSVLSLCFDRKKMPLWQWMGLLIGFAGIGLVVFPHLEIGVSTLWLLGSAGILLSEAVFAWGAIFSKRLLSGGLTPLAVNGFQMFFGSIGLLVLALLFESIHFTFSQPYTAAGALFYLIVFGSIIASGIYYWLVKRTNPLFPSTWLYVSPVIALAVGAVSLDEPIYPLGIAGTVLVIGGVILTSFRDWQKMWKSAHHAAKS